MADNIKIFKQYIEPLFRVLADYPGGVTQSDARRLVADKLGFSELDRMKRHPSNEKRKKGAVIVDNNCAFAYQRLHNCGYANASNGSWRITNEGMAFLSKYPQAIPPAEINRIERKSKPDGRETAPSRSRKPVSTTFPSAPILPAYTLDLAKSDLFIPEEKIREMLDLCRRKKNLILQGPPGVGKTFVASRLAYLLIGVKDDKRVERVQFHPSYSYEDFVQGLRPAEGGGFERTDGPFLRFARRAVEDPNQSYILVIDEINRGNISKILGELLSLIEADKREAMYGVTLAYSREGEVRFHLPANLFLIGTMNTADRALAFVDYALRRRFAFFDIAPAFSSDRFAEDLRRRGVSDELRKTIVGRMIALNNQIREEKALGDGFCVGHSYFCQSDGPFDLDWYHRIVRHEILPLLREYWFDNTNRWESERDRLLGD